MTAPRPQLPPALAARERRPREDALPEHIAYRDEGCDLFASCLTCPLPRCRYDEPGGARTMMNVVRDREIRRLHETSYLNVDELATRFRVSRRTVFRVLQITRDPHDTSHASKPPSTPTCGEARR